MHPDGANDDDDAKQDEDGGGIRKMGIGQAADGRRRMPWAGGSPRSASILALLPLNQE